MISPHRRFLRFPAQFVLKLGNSRNILSCVRMAKKRRLEKKLAETINVFSPIKVFTITHCIKPYRDSVNLQT